MIPKIVRVISKGAVQWVPYAKRLANALPKGGKIARVLDGYLFQIKRPGRTAYITAVDIPSRLALMDSKFDGTNTVTDSVIVISPVRDGFSEGGSPPTFDPLDPKEFTPQEFSSVRRPPYLFNFGKAFDGTLPRYTSNTGTYPFDGGQSHIRRAYNFKLVDGTLDLRPYTNVTDFWAYCEIHGKGKNDIVAVAIDEDTVAAATGGYRFFPRGMEVGEYPISVAIPEPARRTLPDGTDLVCMTIPLTKPQGDYDANTNNLDAGYAALYFIVMEVTYYEGEIDNLQLLYTKLLGTYGQSGPLAAVTWSGDNPVPLSNPPRPAAGVMPNRIFGETVITDLGEVYWAGRWEVSRETSDGLFNFVHIQSIVSFFVTSSGFYGFTRHNTTVCTYAAVDAGDNYLDMDSDAANSYPPYVHALHVFAPAGQLPFFVALAAKIDRYSTPGPSFEIAPSDPTEVWFQQTGALTRLPLPGLTFFAPGALMDISPTFGGQTPMIALVDANLLEPKVGFVLRDTANMDTNNYVRLNVGTGVATVVGVVGSADYGAFGPYPMLTCYQRGESMEDNQGVRQDTKQACLVLSYGVDAKGVTKVSTDGGVTWTQVADIATSRGPFFLGNGYYGYAWDKMFSEVVDNANT